MTHTHRPNEIHNQLASVGLTQVHPNYSSLHVSIHSQLRIWLWAL